MSGERSTVPSSRDGSLESLSTSTSDRSGDVESFVQAEGEVIRVFKKFGFISVSRPVEASVFFDTQAFENGKYDDLTVSGLRVDEEVILDAKKGPRGCKATFRATRVCRLRHASGEEDTRTVSGVIDHTGPSYGFIKFGPNNQKRAFFHLNDIVVPLMGDVKAVHSVLNVGDKVRFEVKPSEKPTEKVKWQATAVHVYESAPTVSGVIDKVGPDYGFIKFGPDNEERAFFHLNDIDDTGDVEAVFSVLSAGDSIRFKVKPSEKPTEKVKWQATAVYVYDGSSDGGRGATSDDKSEIVDHVRREFKEAEEERPAALHHRELGRELQPDRWNRLPSWGADSSEGKGPRERLDTEGKTNSGSEIKQAGKGRVTEGKPEGKPPVSIQSNAKGKVVEVTEHVGRCELQVNGLTNKVTFTSDRFYEDGAPCSDLTKVLRIGDKVRLEYMLGTDGRTAEERLHCDLAWRGHRPIEVAPKLTPEQFAKRLNITTCRHYTDGYEGDSEDDFSPCDGTEEHHGSLGPLKLGGPRRPEYSRPGLDGARASEIEGEGEGAVTRATPLADANEDTLNHLAAILAEELRNLLGCRGRARDVSTQTSSVPRSRPTRGGADEPLAHAGTQTVSTGTIAYGGLFAG